MFKSPLTDDIRLPFSLGEKRELRAARKSGITATKSLKCFVDKFCILPGKFILPGVPRPRLCCQNNGLLNHRW